MKPETRSQSRQYSHLAGVVVIIDGGDVRQKAEQCLSVHHGELVERLLIHGGILVGRHQSGRESRSIQLPQAEVGP